MSTYYVPLYLVFYVRDGVQTSFGLRRWSKALMNLEALVQCLTEKAAAQAGDFMELGGSSVSTPPLLLMPQPWARPHLVTNG